MALARKLNKGMILAFVPTTIVLGGYLALPLMINSLSKLNDYNTMMNSVL